jgi:hypothetical protein
VGLHPLVDAPLVPMLVMPIVLFCFIALISVIQLLRGAFPAGALIPLLVMPLIVVGLVKIDRFCFRRDADFLVSFLTATLDFHEIQAAETPK